jgi:putative flippase GtrA
MRFGVAGSIAFAVYTGGTLLLSGPLSVPIVLAIGVAYPLSVLVNFMLQRHFVFLDRETFALPFRAQLGRYVGAGVCVYALTSVLVSTLPGALGVSPRVVFLIVVVPVSMFSFMLVRGVIFHTPRGGGDTVDGPGESVH